MPDLNELLRNPELEALLRVLLAGALAGLIGFERELEGKPAGIRTYGLVGMGAAIFTTGGMLIFGEGEPASRVAAQIVTGIGFIGAGTILQLRSGVVGLTTAAGLWVSAAVGMVIGGGLYILGVGAALALLLVLFLLRRRNLERLGIADEDDTLNAGEGRPKDTREPEPPTDS